MDALLTKGKVRVVRWLGFLFVCLLVACGGCTEQPSDILRFAVAAAPINLDPRFATDATSARINRLLYERLVDFDDTFQPIPALAAWEQLTPTHYRFYLRDHSREFHDGSRLTSQDIKTTYEFILDPLHGSPHSSALTMIRSIETPTADTIDFFLSRPEPLFPGYLVIGILPARLVFKKHPFHSHPVGSGPFSFQTWLDDTRLRLVRIADRQLFEFVHVPDPTVRVLKLLAGEVQMMQNDLPPELVEFLDHDSRARIHRGRGSNFVYLGFNLQDPLTQRIEVRQAIAQAIDRKAIIQHVLGGAGQTANALLLPTHWAGHPTLPSYSYNPQKARSLLTKAGLNHLPRISLSYKISSDPFRIRLATIVQHQLSQVGLNVNLESYDWGTFYEDIKAGRFQMYSLSWVGIHTPDIFSYIFHSRSIPPHGANRGRFLDSTADRLIEKAESTLDLTEKRDVYRDLQAYLLEQVPYVPLWYEDHVFVAHPDLHGYTIAIDGNYDGLRHIHWNTHN